MFHTHILRSESAIIFLVVLSVKINFTILSNKMVSNDIFNQQRKMLSSNWDKLSQKVTNYDRIEITFVTSTEMLISP